MKYGFYFCLFILLLIILSISCKKHECGEISYLPQDFLDYWYFPEGSYWVYQLKDSTLTDTFIVKRSVEVVVEDDDPIVCRRDYSSTISNKDSAINDKYSGFFFQSSSGLSSGNNNKYSLSLGGTFIFSASVIYPFVIGDTLENNLSYYILKDKNTIITPSGTFNDLIHLIYMKKLCCGLTEVGSEIWLARNAGFVKYISKNRDEWELINYQIK